MEQVKTPDRQILSKKNTEEFPILDFRIHDETLVIKTACFLHINRHLHKWNK